MHPETRVSAIVLILILLFASTAAGYGVVNYSQTLARQTLTPGVKGPDVVIRDVGVLTWNVPARLTQPDLASRVVYDIQAAETPEFAKVFRQFRSNFPSIQIPAGYNRKLYWRVHAGVLRSSAIFEDVDAVGNWSNVVATEHYASVYDRIRRTGLLRALTSTNNFTGIYKFYSGKLFRGVEPILLCSLAQSLTAEMGRKISVVNSAVPFGDMSRTVEGGTVDMAAASITLSAQLERDWNVRFSVPYATTGMAVISNLDLHPEKPLWAALQGGTLGVHLGRTSVTCGKALSSIAGVQGEAIKLKDFEDINDAFRRLAAGQFDHLITDQSIIEGWKSIHGNRFRTRVVAESDFAAAADKASVPAVCWAQNYGVMVRPGEERFLASLNKALGGYVASGKMKSIEGLAREQLYASNDDHAGNWATQARSPEEYCGHVLKELATYEKAHPGE
jgi:ABC-type amino acid transport substrate-binding protein